MKKRKTTFLLFSILMVSQLNAVSFSCLNFKNAYMATRNAVAKLYGACFRRASSAGKNFPQKTFSRNGKFSVGKVFSKKTAIWGVAGAGALFLIYKGYKAIRDLYYSFKLYSACENNNEDTVRRLCPNLNPGVANSVIKGVTPLYLACKNNNLKMVNWIIPHCSSEIIDEPSLVRDLGKLEAITPLNHACRNNNLEMVKVLIERGSRVREKDLEQAKKTDIDRTKVLDYLEKTIEEDSDRLVKREVLFRIDDSSSKD